MTLQQLKYMITVAEKGTISEAAKSLFISQPSLTNAMKDLEKEINLTLFIRTNRGIELTREGSEFLGYARQVAEQASLLEERYLGEKPARQRFSVSTQHYAFAVNAFVDLIKEYGLQEYDFTLRETRTYEIIDDVKNLRSEIGVLYLNAFNEKVIQKLIKESGLVFRELFCAAPHVFISSAHVLAEKDEIRLEDLEEYPYLSFEQGEYNSFYFSEEILSTLERKKNIKVSDRATLFNLLIGLNGYTICTGVLSEELNGRDIVARPLIADEKIRVGTIMHKDITPGKLGRQYLEFLEKHTYQLPDEMQGGQL